VNTDIKTYDCGNLYVSQYGLAANTGTLGELRVRYCCRFSEPVLEASQVVGGAMHFSSITATTANNFAGAVVQAGGTPFMSGISLSAASNTITWPASIPGNYLVLIAVQGATSASGIGENGFTGGVTGLNLFTSGGARDAQRIIASLAGTTTSPAMFSASLSVTTAGGTYVINPSTIVSSGAGSVDVFIVSLPATVLTAPEPVNNGEDRVAALELQVARLVGLLSPSVSRSASCMTASEVEEETKCQKIKTDADSSDELGSSVHIPRGLLSQFMRGSAK